MTNEDDIAFLENFRAQIDAFLVAGEAPTQDPLWGGRNLLKMKDAMKDPTFRALRQDINRMKGRAAQILERLSIGCTFKQYPPPAVGGPTLKIPLFDLIVENRSVHTLDGTVFTDKIDEAIGRLQSEEASTPTGTATPVFAANDLAAAIEFYRDTLKFECRQHAGTAKFAIVGRDTARILLSTDSNMRPGRAFVETRDPALLANEFAAKGLALRDTADGALTGFEITDPDGNILIFGNID